MFKIGEVGDLKYVRLQVPLDTHRKLRLLAARDEVSIAMYTRGIVVEAVDAAEIRLPKTHLPRSRRQ